MATQYDDGSGDAPANGSGNPDNPENPYISTDPYAGGGGPVAPGPGAAWSGNQSPAADPVAAKWRIGQAIPDGYETYHPNNDPSQLAIRRIGGMPGNASPTGAPPVPSGPIKIGDTQTGSDGQTYTWNGKTWATGATTAPTGATGAASPYGGDPTNVDTWLDWLATQPGHDPILDTPQGKGYYKQRIGETGGLNANNLAYWQNKGTLSSSGGAVGAPEGGSLTQGAPSLADLQNNPGFKWALEQGQNAVNRSAAAKGTALTGGTLKDLADYTTGATLNAEFFPYWQLQNQSQQNNANNLYNIANLGFNASSYGSK